jgi:hypothetical protein
MRDCQIGAKYVDIWAMNIRTMEMAYIHLKLWFLRIFVLAGASVQVVSWGAVGELVVELVELVSKVEAEEIIDLIMST